MSVSKDIYDITIIGAGPVGLFAAFYSGIRQAKTKIIDTLPQLGGQLSALYPEKYIYDVPGFPAIKANELIKNLSQQIKPFDHTLCLDEEVTSLVQEHDYLRIETAKGCHYSKAVIIAVGNGSFQPRRLGLENAEMIEGHSLHYHITDLSQFSEKRVAIAGGGDSAIDWALMLEPIADTVSLIHRRTDFRGHEHSVNKLLNSTVTLYTPFVIDALLLENDQFTGVQLKEAKSDQLKKVSLDALIVSHGYTSSLSHLKKWGLLMKRNAIEVFSDMSTNIPGVYAVGDSCIYEGKVKLIATGFGEAPTAVNNALHYIRPASKTQPMHSTSLFEGKDKAILSDN